MFLSIIKIIQGDSLHIYYHIINLLLLSYYTLFFIIKSWNKVTNTFLKGISQSTMMYKRSTYWLPDLFYYNIMGCYDSIRLLNTLKTLRDLKKEWYGLISSWADHELSL